MAYNSVASESATVQKPNKSTSGKYLWRIENVSNIQTGKLYSEPFPACGHDWRILIFPRGNVAPDSLAFYLDVGETAHFGWTKFAYFWLNVINQKNKTLTVRKECRHKFTSTERDWGFTTYMPLVELYDASRGFIVDDTLIVEAEVSVRSEDWVYDSKKATGYVGLKNQGATCYMNSLLQTLFHFPSFRKAVYHMPTTEEDMPEKSIPLALQTLFHKLQYSDTSVSTKDLTKSLWWDTVDSFMQHDVQELNRVLYEKLEDKMKGTVVEGTIERLFEGHHMNYIECINVEYKSTRKESFYDLQLDVKNCKDVYASFDKYVEVEMMDGENKYHAEQYGLQDARKGVLFTDFPPVLQLQLKRFEYDFMRDTMVKINDRYEFPLELDLDRENGKYLSPDSDRSIENKYTLHSVLVHSGGVNGGHYYAFIRPTLSDQWYKFDDERVTREDAVRALDEQYGDDEVAGGVPNAYRFTKYSNAYMLVYIRKSDIQKVVCTVDESDIAAHLLVRLKSEQKAKELKKKEKAESHLYVHIRVARDDDMMQQVGKGGFFFDLVDHSNVASFRVQKELQFLRFKEDLAKKWGIPVEQQRFWVWAKRKNNALRLVHRLTPSEELQEVGSLVVESMKDSKVRTSIGDLRLYLQVVTSQESMVERPIGSYLLLFFKAFDPEKEELRFLCSHFVAASHSVQEYLPGLCKLAGFENDEQLVLWEEIRHDPEVKMGLVDVELTFEGNKLADGDIICIQKTVAMDSPCRFHDIRTFLDYIKNKLVVRFRRLESPLEDVFTIELSKTNGYDDVVGKLAHQLALEDPNKIRLTQHNHYNQAPRPAPIRFRSMELTEMLVQYQQPTDILYFEVLDIPLPELEALKSLKIYFYSQRSDEETGLNIRLPKESNVGQLLQEVKQRVQGQLSRPEASLRLMEIYGSKIFKILHSGEPIDTINDNYWIVKAEEVPVEEEEAAPESRLVHVAHFSTHTVNQVIYHFGEPFLLSVSPIETLGEVKQRIQKKLRITPEEFSKWKFARLHSMGKTEYFEDDKEVLAPLFQHREMFGFSEHILGLEHVDSHPQIRRHAQNQRYSYEKAVKIHN